MDLRTTLTPSPPKMLAALETAADLASLIALLVVSTASATAAATVGVETGLNKSSVLTKSGRMMDTCRFLNKNATEWIYFLLYPLNLSGLCSCSNYKLLTSTGSSVMPTITVFTQNICHSCKLLSRDHKLFAS